MKITQSVKMTTFLKFFFPFILCVACLEVYGQSPESIVIQLEGKSGAEYVRLANQASEAYYKKRKYNEAAEYAEDAWRISKNIGDKELLADSYINWGKAILKKSGSSTSKKAYRRNAAKYFRDAVKNTRDDVKKLEALKLVKQYASKNLSTDERNQLNAAIASLEQKINPVSSTESTTESPKESGVSEESKEKKVYAIDKINEYRRLGKKLKEKEAKLLEDHQAEINELEGKYEVELAGKAAEIDTMSIDQAKKAALLAQEQLVNERLKNKVEKDSLELIAVSAELKEVEAINEMQEVEKEKLRIGMLGAISTAFLFFLILIISVRLNKKVKREKKKSDALLGNILPKHIIEALKGKTVNKDADIIAEKHSDVSVLFLDFKGFSAFAKEKRDQPKEVVQLLNTYFKRFDDIIVNKYGLEKIKTIGDAYMCAAGIHPNKGDRKKYKRKQAEKLVQAALEINRFIKNEAIIAQKKNRPYFEGRIGIHTGDVIAGVVGEKKYAYDIWGDTVNTASRVESNGAINTVNISESTKALLGPKFSYSSSRSVDAKNIGQINIYNVGLS